MRLFLIFAALLTGAGCAAAPVIRHEAGAFSARDYLKTAYDTLADAETDTGGHRVRAQRETKAALALLGTDESPPRAVPYVGPPTLAVALALLEHTAPELPEQAPARNHTQRAVNELREALK